MLDFSFAELLVVVVLAVFLIGPEEMPKMMVALGRIVRRFQYMRFAMSQQFEEFMRVHDLEDLQKSVNFEARHTEGKDFDEAAADEEEFDEAYIEAYAQPEIVDADEANAADDPAYIEHDVMPDIVAGTSETHNAKKVRDGG